MLPDQGKPRFSNPPPDRIDALDERLRGCTSVNLPKIAEEYFTPEYLSHVTAGLLHSVRMTEGMGKFMGTPIYRPSELYKCITHHCSRELIKDLWSFGEPAVQATLTPDGRFDLDRDLIAGKRRELTDDLEDNLEVGAEIIHDLTTGIFDGWWERIKELDAEDPLSTMFVLYRLHSVLLNGGDWEKAPILFSTFTSTAENAFKWMVERPDLSREELERALGGLLETNIDQAGELGVESSAKEDVVQEATEWGEYAYVLDEETRKVVFNPFLLEEVDQMVENQREIFPDQTQLVLTCPAMHVRSHLYPRGSMLHDLIRFRASVYTEIYLATQERRKAASTE